MLFSHRLHAPIASGEVTRTVRRWKRPQAKAAGRYRLASGDGIEVDSIEAVSDSDLTADDATRSGFPSLAALRAALPERVDTTLYRIDFHHIGPLVDPRAVLAANAELDDDELGALRHRLDQMDARSARPWVAQTLRQIEAHPATVSHQLAAATGFETAPFKANVRKLKALGLTISLERGYRLSPRGDALLAYLRLNP
jgi:hypothetical protein